jgi:hypothetical protein
VDGLRVTHLALLATASRDARPTTTLVSWLWPVDPTRLLFALDRRGLAFKNLIENPFAALEILIGQFAGAARGTVTILPECLMTPFPCSVALLQLAEVRRHDVDGVIVLPPRYEFAGDKQHYARTDGAIVDQLAEIAIRIEAGQD